MIDVLHVVVCKKPQPGGVVDGVLERGVGSVNVDGCRVPSGGETFTINTWDDGSKPFGGGAGHAYTSRASSGRHPANVIHDGSDTVVSSFPRAGNEWKKNYGQESYIGRQGQGGSFGGGGYSVGATHCDSGSASRFFWSYD